MRQCWHATARPGDAPGQLLMRLQASNRVATASLPPDLDERQSAAAAPKMPDRNFQAPAPARNWVADDLCLASGRLALCCCDRRSLVLTGEKFLLFLNPPSLSRRF
jgi:hypothetical protein